MSVRYRLGVLAALLAATLAACQLLVGVNDEVGVARHDAGVAGAAGAGGGSDAGPDAEDPCPKTLPPPPPSVIDAGEGPRLTFAFKTLRVRPKGEPAIGYDLDGRCTGDPNDTLGPVCTAPGGGSPIPDDKGGIDNSFGQAIDKVAGLELLGPDPLAVAANSAIESGQRTIVLVIFRYNGMADDDSVDVAVVASEGLESVSCGAFDAGASDGGTLSPQWMGCDTWSYAKGSDVIDHIPVTTHPGYVTNRVLVVKPDGKKPIEIPFGGGLWQLYGVITANIEAETTYGGPAYALRGGIVSGRVMATQVIDGVGHVTLMNNQLCQAAPRLLDVLREAGCAARDIPTLSANDGKDEICDAISVAFGFEALPAELGDEGPPPMVDPCTGFDPSCPDDAGAD